MNYGQRQQVPASPSGRRQKTVPLNGHNPLPYNQSPRPHTNKSPRPSKRKKKDKHRDRDRDRVRAKTSTNGIIKNSNNNNNQWHSNQHNNPPSPQPIPSNNMWRSSHTNQMSPRPMNQINKNTINYNQWNNNSNVSNVQPYAPHNPSNTMMQHNNHQHNHHNVNIYSDNALSNSTSHTTPIPVASVYQSRIECVWSIDIFQKPDVAKNFCCLTCGDIPRYTLNFVHYCMLIVNNIDSNMHIFAIRTRFIANIALI